MKIALVSDWYHPRVGGIELHLQDLARHLGAAGHDVVIITPTPGAPLVDGLRVVRIDAPLAPVFHFLATPSGTRAVGNALERERVDVVHCHVSIISPAALGGAHHAQRLRLATVLTFHSVVPQTHLLARAASLALGTANWKARFTAVSQRVARDVSAMAAGQPVTVLPNGIEAANWRVSHTPNDDHVRLVSVMRLNRKKRPLALVELMRHLPDASNVTMRIAGDGPERDAVQRAIASAGLEHRIKLLGRRTRGEIRTLFGESDIFVLPTLRESFGLAALEARCAGLPVVAMRASGVAELIEHDRDGLLAASDRDLVGQVAALVADPRRRARIADHNRQTLPPHDWARVLDAHLSVYREAIALRDSVRVDTYR